MKGPIAGVMLAGPFVLVVQTPKHPKSIGMGDKDIEFLRCVIGRRANEDAFKGTSSIRPASSRSGLTATELRLRLEASPVKSSACPRSGNGLRVFKASRRATCSHRDGRSTG
jgi:hypothetical protein